MPRASQINGVPVICLADGSRLGKVKQIVVDSKRAAVVAFGVEGPHWWRPCRVVEIGAVAGLSGEVLVVATAQSLTIIEEQPQLEQLLLAESDLAGRPVLASTGRFIGRVKDFGFDHPSGAIGTIVVQPNGDPAAAQEIGAELVSVLGRDAVIVCDQVASGSVTATSPTALPSAPVVASPDAQRAGEPARAATFPAQAPAATFPAQAPDAVRLTTTQVVQAPETTPDATPPVQAPSAAPAPPAAPPVSQTAPPASRAAETALSPHVLGQHAPAAAATAQAAAATAHTPAQPQPLTSLRPQVPAPPVTVATLPSLSAPLRTAGLTTPATPAIPAAAATPAAPATPAAAGTAATPATPAAPAATPTTGADLARLFRERQERFLLGKTAQRAVRDDEGLVLVDADQVVDQETLDKVKAAGKLLELTASVSMRK